MANLTSFASLPSDLRNIELIKYLTVPSFLRYCSINRSFSNLCNNPKIWRMFLERDYPDYPYKGQYPRVMYRLIGSYLQNGKNARCFWKKEIPQILNLDEKTLSLLSTLFRFKLLPIWDVSKRIVTFEYQLRPTTKLRIIQNEFDKSIDLSFEEIYPDPVFSTTETTGFLVAGPLDFIDSYINLIDNYLKIPAAEYLINPNIQVKLAEPLIKTLGLNLNHPKRSKLAAYNWRDDSGASYVNIYIFKGREKVIDMLKKIQKAAEFIRPLKK